MEELLKETPKPKWGCFFIAAPAPVAAILLTIWVMFA